MSGVRLPLLIRTGNPVGLQGAVKELETWDRLFLAVAQLVVCVFHRTGEVDIMSTFPWRAGSASEVKTLVCPLTDCGVTKRKASDTWLFLFMRIDDFG